MTQPDLLDRARQGDCDAIAALLNRTLAPRGVTAKVALKAGCLRILLTSSRLLDQQTFVTFLQQQVSCFSSSDRMQSVKIYSHQLGEDLPDWSQDCELEFFAHPLAAATDSTPPNLDQSKQERRDFWANLRTFQLAAVFPYRDALSTDLYRDHTVRLLMFFGLFPLLVDLLDNQASLARVAWLLGIYYASIWGVVLYNLIRPPQFSWADTLKCVLFTAFLGIPLLLLLQQVPPFSALYAAIRQGLMARLVGFVLGVGVLEEVCKALPIYLFLLRPNRLRDPLTSAFYGAMSGLGFAIAEGATYSLVYGLGLSRGFLGLGSYVIANTIRFVSLPLFHAILAGIVGYFIGLAAINPARQGAIIFIGVAIAAVLHGLYNSFAGGIFGLLVISFSILLFVTYLRRSQHMVDEMHQAETTYRQAQKK